MDICRDRLIVFTAHNKQPDGHDQLVPAELAKEGTEGSRAMSQEKPDNKLREEGRPDPEALLSRYHLHDNEVAEDTGELPAAGQHPESYQHIRGRLRIYLAAVTGAGKTYNMLAEGHRRKMRSTD